MAKFFRVQARKPVGKLIPDAVEGGQKMQFLDLQSHDFRSGVGITASLRRWLWRSKMPLIEHLGPLSTALAW
jgi:hypothetical protein